MVAGAGAGLAGSVGRTEKEQTQTKRENGRTEQSRIVLRGFAGGMLW